VAVTPPSRVVLDANVLFPAPLRDVLLAAAAHGWIEVRWTERILRETLGSLVRTGWLAEDDAPRLRRRLERACPSAPVTGYEHLEAGLRNAPEDRHVAAAALHAGASLVITRNLRDFRKLPPGLRAQAPDALLRGLLRERPAEMARLLRALGAAGAADGNGGGLPEWLALLAKVAPGFVREARDVIGQGAQAG